MNPICHQALFWRAICALIVPDRSSLAEEAYEAEVWRQSLQLRSKPVADSEPCASTDYSMVIPKPTVFSGASFTQTTAEPYSLLHMSTACSWLAKVTGVSHNICIQSSRPGLFFSSTAFSSWRDSQR
jgi:hypothetical protein